MRRLSLTLMFIVVLFLVGADLRYIYSLHYRTPSVSTKLSPIVRLVRNGRTTCTGVVVSPTVIITASHCVLEDTIVGPMINEEPIEIRNNDNLPTKIMAKPYAARVQLDQALLFGDFSRFEARAVMTDVRELNKLAHEGQIMTACGYPMGGPMYCSRMHFNELYDFMWAVTGILIPGMSGGPVMLSDGTVVAINVAVHGDQSIVSPIYNIDMNFKDKK
jgi:V8-like Glu-specific endopeptidase